MGVIYKPKCWADTAYRPDFPPTRKAHDGGWYEQLLIEGTIWQDDATGLFWILSDWLTSMGNGWKPISNKKVAKLMIKRGVIYGGVT